MSLQVQTRFLSHTNEQRHTVADFYDAPEGQHSYRIFEKGDPAGQTQARALLIELGLDQVSRNALDSRWNVQWSTAWDVGWKGDSRKCTLFQWCLFLIRGFKLEIQNTKSDFQLLSCCGYDPNARKDREKRKQGVVPTGLETCYRRVPYDFTGCLAYVEIIERASDGEITRVAGYFEHNLACKAAVLKRLPAVPLHNHVYEIALEQLEVGARWDLLF